MVNWKEQKRFGKKDGSQGSISYLCFFTALLPAAPLHTMAPWQGRSGGEQAEGGTHLGSVKPDSPDGR